MRSTILITGLLILFLGIFTLYAFVTVHTRRAITRPNEPAPVAAALTAPPPVTPADPVRGRADAKHSIIEYGDLTCEACRAAEPALHALVAARSDVRLAWRDFPIERINPFSKRAAIAGRCAHEQQKFWEYHDALLARSDLLPDDALLDEARSLGVDLQKFSACLADPQTSAVVAASQQEAVRLGATGAPDIFINGARYTGPLTVADLSAALPAP